MPGYELRYGSKAAGGRRIFMFEGDDPSEALRFAHQHHFTGPAELWEEGHRICELERQPIGDDEVWVVRHRQ